MDHFLVFKKLKGEKIGAYSVVNDQIYNTIPKGIIFAEKLIKHGMYTNSDLEKMRDDLCK